ncbi:MAG: HU family DNA-binding protein [Odoribacter sp.]
MNRAELVRAMAEKANLSQVDCKKALEAFIQTVSETLPKDEKVVLVGFGTFSVIERSARNGRNPQTGKLVLIPAKRVAKFKAGIELLEKI